MTTKTRARATKKAQLIQMLSTKTGADVEAISGKLGWQSHTTRAAITMLKKAGYEVAAEKESGKPTCYRIIAEPPAVAAGEEVMVPADRLIEPEPADAR